MAPADTATHRLIALAVFFKSACFRSFHIYEQSPGQLYKVQQDFLFTPGAYTRVGTPLFCEPLRIETSPQLMKHMMLTLIREQESHGWQCALQYAICFPFQTIIPDILFPSKNPYLKSIPALEQDLFVVERAVSEMNKKFNANATSTKTGWDSPSLSLCPSGQNFEKSHSAIGLETFQQATHDAKFNIRHQWGSDLGLASPKMPSIIYSHSDQETPNSSTSSSRTSPGNQWTSYNVLDLNLDITELTSDNNDSDCTGAVAGNVIGNSGMVNLELKPSSLKFHPSVVTEGISDCFNLECFGTHSPHCHVSATNESLSATPKKRTISICSDESIGNTGIDVSNGVLGHIISPMEVNCHSYTTSSSMNSGPRVFDVTCLDGGKLFEESPATSTDHSWRCDNKVKASSSSTTQSQPSNANTATKPRFVRANSTSERITEITLQELSQYFHMPITQASKELKVGLTVLKKRCREFGIPRWPHRKMKSLESLIHNIQDLAKDQGVKSSARVLNAVKELEEQKKLMEDHPGTELAERTKRLRQACFKANYKKRRLGLTAARNLPANPSPALDLNRTVITSPCQIGFL